ncbi:hypothetical protein ABCR94_38035 [Streptomyces sp. 21So2-11]|uniref:hypothetical protein n=1 Tax=Streptomyces sp. 21So2-11 TaxID=3144408 RepID=UPI00321BA347
MTISAARQQQEARHRARQEAERRRREAERAAERQRREAARAEARRRRMAELAETRRAQDEKRLVGVRMERARAAERRLTELEELMETLGASGTPGDAVKRIGVETAQLRERLRHGADTTVDEEIERLRGRAVRLQSSAQPGPTAGSGRVVPRQALKTLGLRLADLGPQAVADDPEGHRGCGSLIDQLHTALEEGRTARFEALLGTAEHRLTQHAAAVGEAAETRRREAAQEAEREARRAEVSRLAAEEERLRRESLEEAADRLDTIADAVRDAIRDAVDSAETALADELRTALAEVTDALGAGRATAALAALAGLEEVLPRAEAALDELLLAYERRTHLARTLQNAMSGAGFTFTGGNEQDRGLLLRFARSNGALYSATVASAADGAPVLAYRVDGEADVSVVPAAAEAVCDSTEELLEQVHEAMAGDGFVPGELQWEGKPPGSRGPGLRTVRKEWRR